MIIAALLIAWPLAANAYIEAHNADIIVGIVGDAETDDPEKLAIREETARQCAEYNANLKLGHMNYEDYMSLLDVDGTGLMGVVKIPSVNIALPIYHGTTDAEMHKGAGHMFGSALPVGGVGNNPVLASHSGSSTQKLFSDLPNVQINDYVYLYVNGEKLTYKVDLILSVFPEESEYLSPTVGEDRLTLITCTPFGINTHRLLVCCIRVEDADDESEPDITESRGSIYTLIYTVPIVALVTAGAGYFIYRTTKRKKKGKTK